MSKTEFIIENYTAFKEKMLNWVKQFSIFCFLDGNGYSADNSFDTLLAAGSTRSIQLDANNGFRELRKFYDQQPDWVFGHFGYSLMNETENVFSAHPADMGFGAGFFFSPKILIRLSADRVIISGDTLAEKVYHDILSFPVNQAAVNSLQIQHAVSKNEYVEDINALLNHIRLGDCYEVNYCQKFFSENAKIDPISTYLRLAEASPNPFSALYRMNDLWCLCASPERFIKKTGSRVISQPMKGTSRRSDDPTIDRERVEELLNSEKEKSENVMIVDLVRNDLSKFCNEGSVRVEELFGIYSFPFVHQMVSTVAGEISSDIHWTDVVKNCFPMGSMTGAPKKRVLELIDKYESSARGLFSGSIGWINPEGDFDLNVVIRSIFYDAALEYISFNTGSGITCNSIPEQEYEESLLKAAAIMKVLNAKAT